MAFRVVTYNVHKCRGLDRQTTAVRIADVLREIDPDIVALQEIMEHQVEVIARELTLAFVMGENRKHRGYLYGNAVLSRFPISASRNYDLTVQGRESRGCLRADVVSHNSLLHVFNVHLGTSFRERREQASRLIAADLLSEVGLGRPRLVLGDFNEWTSGLVTQLLRSHMQSADIQKHLRRSRTYPGLLPFLHLDHIYYDPELKLDRLTLCRTRKALVASDHLPLAAEFTVS
ncbi:MAG: endonuclease/exonuclease/phosphatase family protein [Bryobacteraceae bacterium]|jgi:endonuclease/exonuclease/phosphatase family metal-dependent hydrolase